MDDSHLPRYMRRKKPPKKAEDYFKSAESRLADMEAGNVDSVAPGGGPAAPPPVKPPPSAITSTARHAAPATPSKKQRDAAMSTGERRR